MLLSIEQFCDKHDACLLGRKWAIEHCSDMLDAWNKLPYDYMLWVFKRPEVVLIEEAVDFAEFCANNAKAYSKIFIQGSITNYVTKDLARNAKHCLESASYNLRVSKVKCCTYVTYYAAEAAYYAVKAATYASGVKPKDEEKKQLAWLRANVKPNFEG